MQQQKRNPDNPKIKNQEYIKKKINKIFVLLFFLLKI